MKIVAIGGGNNRRFKSDGREVEYQCGKFDLEIINLTGKNRPNLLFLGHAKPEVEQEGYFRGIKDIFENIYGCHCEILKSSELEDTNYVNKLLDWADIIYESGGDTFEMVELWKKTGFDLILKEALDRDKVLCGISAGAICWFLESLTDTLQIKYGPDQPLISMTGLGFINMFVTAHADDPGRYEIIKETLRNNEMVGIAIPNGFAMEIVDDQFRIIKSDSQDFENTCNAYCSYWKNGEYIVRELEVNKFFPLNEILSIRETETKKLKKI